MRRGRILIFLLLIVVIGLVVAVVAIRGYLATRAPQQPLAKNVQVYVAGQNIAQGAKITADELTTITLPQDKVSAVEFTTDQTTQLINKVAKFPLDQGVVITSSMVTDSSQAIAIAGPPWAALIPPGMTAVSIPASRLSLVSYGVSDGAHVNLNACFLFVDVDPGFQSMTPNTTTAVTAAGLPAATNLPIITLGVGAAGGVRGRFEADSALPNTPFYVIPSEPQRPRVVCQTILQNVVVMKSGNFPLNSSAAPAAQTQPAQGATIAPDIITLIVSPQDAITLSYMAYTNAQIMMTLRNPSDQSRLATQAATLQFLLSQYNIPVPAKLPYAQQPRIDSLTPPTLTNPPPTQ